MDGKSQLFNIMETINPKISVLMATYNAEKYLKEAMDSILNQTFKDFEFIIIDDDSNDKTVEIIKSYSDPRIKLIINPSNLGLPTSLNKGIEFSSGEFLVRMDPDDISLPERFTTQIEFMNKHNDIVICGSNAKSIGSKNNVIMSSPNNSDEIKVSLLFKTTLIHPTIFIRKSFLVKNELKYSPQFLQTQDYDLYTRASTFGKLANINKVLLLYRKHDKQASSEKIQNQFEYAKTIIKRQLVALGMNPANKEIEIALSVKRYLFLDDKNFPEKLEGLMQKIINANKTKNIYSEKAMKSVFGSIWLEVCLAYKYNKINIWKSFWNGKPRKWIPIRGKNFYRIVKILI